LETGGGLCSLLLLRPQRLNLFFEAEQVRHVPFRLPAHVAHDRPAALFQLAYALVAQLNLLLGLAVFQLQHGKFAQQLAMHGHQLLQTLLQRSRLDTFAFADEFCQGLPVRGAQVVDLQLELRRSVCTVFQVRLELDTLCFHFFDPF
jgi:hypothetical protein